MPASVRSEYIMVNMMIAGSLGNSSVKQWDAVIPYLQDPGFRAVDPQ